MRLSSLALAPTDVPLQLPVEVIEHILHFLTGFHSELYSCCLVSRIWYSCTIPILWNTPKFLSHSNFLSFRDSVTTKYQLARLIHNFNFEDYTHENGFIALELLQYLPNLRKLHTSSYCPLHLNNMSFTEPTVFHGHLSSLRYIELCRDSDVESLANVLERCPNLSELGLVINESSEGFKVAKSLIEASFPSLRSLVSFEVRGDAFEGSLIKALIRLMPNLLQFELDIDFGHYIQDLVDEIVSVLSEGCPNIKALRFSFSGNSIDVSFWRFFNDLINKFGGRLQECSLHFDYVELLRLPDALIGRFCQSLNNVQTLKLAGIQFTDSFLNNLATSTTDQLHTLILNRVCDQNNLGKEAWSELFSKRGPRLNSLSVEDSMVPDNIGHMIGTHCKQLQRLSMSGTVTNQKSLDALFQGCGNTLLYLNLSSSTFHISSDVLHAMSTHCHRLQEVDISCRIHDFGKPREDEELFEFMFKRLGNRVRFLDIRGWAINDNILNTISTWGSSLEMLAFNDQSDLTDHSVRRLTNSCCRMRKLFINSWPGGGISLVLWREVGKKYICYFP
ncbi:hypothetical protein K7432_000175 [Basidiobolus ranarum]|uniref:F-box domain-containing protein n=1 Tax=Basidiobolus ranarum TaxID=34480 RepID=A0ABR2X519_9FUNG